MKHSVIQIIKDHYRLPYPPGVSGGVDNVLLGVYAILKPDTGTQDLRHAIIDAIDPSKLGKSPSITMDPIGHLFGFKPICNLEFYKNQLITNKRSELSLLLDGFIWNKYHVALCDNALQYVIETCRQHYIQGNTDFSKDSALIHRFRQQMPHVMVAPVDVIPGIDSQTEHNVEQVLLQAKAQLRIVRPGFRFHKNGLTTAIHRKIRKETKVDFLAVQLGLTLPPQHRIAVLNWAKTEENEDAESVLEAQNNELLEGKSFAELCARRRRPPEDFTPIPPPRGVGEVHFRKIICEAISSADKSDAACFAALISTTFLSVEDLAFAKIIKNDECRYLVTPRPHITRVDPPDPSLHLQVETEYFRRIPTQLISAAERLIPCQTPEQLQEKLNLWLHQRGCSLSGFIHGLRFNLPCWGHLSWIPSEFGLNKVRFDEAGKPKMPGYTHYLVYSPAEYEPGFLQYFDRLGLATLPDPNVEKIPFCGSKNCVSPQIAAEMLKKLLELISATEVYQSSDYIYLAAHCNAISGLVRLFEVFLTFRRNYPASPPLMLPGNTGIKLLSTSGMIREKVRPRRYVIGPNLAALLANSATVVRRTVRKLEEIGYSIIAEDDKPVDYLGYGFLPLTPTGKDLILLGPSKSRIVHGLAHHPGTEKFSGIAGNAFRNLSYFLLASDPTLSLVAKALHDHASGGGATRRNYAGVGMHCEIAKKAESHILNKLGFPKGLFS